MRDNNFVMEFKGLMIFEKDGVFTIGGPHNAEFDDCTFENLEYGPDETELVAYCRENGIPLQFDDLRGHVYDLPHEKYLEHLDKFKADPDGGFTDYEFIVPSVRCLSLEQAKQLIDWIDKMERSTSIADVLSNAAYRAGDTVRNGKEPENTLD